MDDQSPDAGDQSADVGDQRMDRQKRKKFPTMFCVDGSIYMHPDSMLELYTQLSDQLWQETVKETVEYYVYLQALKTVGMPILREQWTKLCQYYLEGLEVAVHRMRNLDALLVSRIDQEALLKAYSEHMKSGATEAVEQIKKILADVEGQEPPADLDILMVPGL